MPTTRAKCIAISACLAFGLAACGSDSNSDATTTAAVATTVADTVPDTTAAPDTTEPDTTVPATDAPDTSVEEVYELVDISGEYLTDTFGFTLYIFTQDPVDGGVSACYDSCATTWPPVVIPEGDFLLSIPEGFDEIPRDDGLGQLTYQGSPLYYYSGDSAPGDRNGDGVGGVWFAVALTG